MAGLACQGSDGRSAPKDYARALSLGRDDLQRVFQEVLSSIEGRRVPVQFLYSNAVHGAEGPIDEPDPPAKR